MKVKPAGSTIPVIFADLEHACGSIGMLLRCADRWLPENDTAAIADAIRPHLQAAARIVEQSAREHKDTILASSALGYDRIDRVCAWEFATLREALSGRVAAKRKWPAEPEEEWIGNAEHAEEIGGINETDSIRRGI